MLSIPKGRAGLAGALLAHGFQTCCWLVIGSVLKAHGFCVPLAYVLVSESLLYILLP